MTQQDENVVSNDAPATAAELKAQIFGTSDTPTELVHIPEWNLSVRVKALSAKERDAFELSTVKGTGKNQRQDLSNIRARLVALTVVDPQGGRVFGDDDIARLGDKSAAALDRIFGVAQRLSRFSDTDVEELAGNSGRDRSVAGS